MLKLIGSLIEKPVLSLRTGAPVAVTVRPLINPNNLKIEGFYSDDRFEKKQLILLVQEIREILTQGFVVNDHESLAELDDLVRLQDVIKLNFELMGKPVVTVSKQKVGKINDYAVDESSFYVQKLYVGQPLLKSISGGQLSIDRADIVEITDRKIVVQEILRPNPARATATAG